MDRSEYTDLLHDEMHHCALYEDWEAFWYLSGFLKSFKGERPRVRSFALDIWDNAFHMGWEDGKSLCNQDEFF